MPVSSEFVALCRAQITLLTQALGASISIIYLTQDLENNGQPRLIAIAAHPESLIEFDSQPHSYLLPAAPPPLQSGPHLVASDSGNPRCSETTEFINPPSSWPNQTQPEATANFPPNSALVEQRQLVLPLIYEEGVLGLLVTRRDDRAWEAWEHRQIEAIAQSLALACVMDQRYLWGEREREQERLIRLQQHDLMDNVLHQFRNSLTALQTFTKLILRRLAPGDRNQELVANIQHETDRLRELAQQMEWALDPTLSSRPRSLPGAGVTTSEAEQLGAATLEPQPLPLLPSMGLLPSRQLTLERCLLEPILEPLLASAEAIAADQQLTLETALPDDLPPIWANPPALREALNNLLENAIKYTPAGGRILVRAESPDTSSVLEISISDTGVGIPTADLPHIFERHYRGVQAQGEIPGSGLGLAITRSLIEQMHGNIQVFSPALTAGSPSPAPSAPLTPGTTFMIQLPIAIADEKPEATAS